MSGYVIGVDFGTLSGRALVVQAADGAELGSAVCEYPHAVLETTLPDGRTELPGDWALQDPEDYLEVLREAVPGALREAGVAARDVDGIAIDFTACTVLPTLRDGTPLCRLERFAARPHAYVKLWKHHAAQPQADRITALAHERGEDWIARYGGRISSEWTFAKGLQMLEEDAEVYAAAERFIEATDWVVWQLCGEETRNACTAGYKELLQDGAYPSSDYLAALHPEFASFAQAKLAHPIARLGERAGGLTAQAANWTGLSEGIAVAVGNVDAHVTPPAAQAIDPGMLVAVMGTSTCHVMNGETLAEAPGMCGVVKDGITTGYWGYEAGQSAVGDIFAWYAEHGVPRRYHERAHARNISVHHLLTEEGERQPIGGHGLIALDWMGGNRSTLVDHTLSGLIVGLTLATRPPEIYRALLESTAYGTRAIIENFRASGVPVRELVVAGGLLRNPVLMQIYADVCDCPISIIESDQGPALGAAIHAAVAAGLHPDVPAAAAAMGRRRRAAYTPDPARAAAYDELYREYTTLYDYFGRGANEAMHRLHAIRTRVNRGQA